MHYRPAVAAILQDRSGRILICERTDTPGAWQFPQGGIEGDESPWDALDREVLEEISLPREAYAISAVKGPYRYRFPAGLTKKGFRGQSHHYFLLRLRKAKSLVNVAGPGREFRRVRWIWPHEFHLEWLPPMKRRAYRRVLQDFFGGAMEIKGRFRLTPMVRKGMKRADFLSIFSMLTIGSFAIAVFAILAGVFWACLNDRDQT